MGQKCIVSKQDQPLVDLLGDLLDLGRVVLLVVGDQLLGQVVELLDVDFVLVNLGME